MASYRASFIPGTQYKGRQSGSSYLRWEWVSDLA